MVPDNRGAMTAAHDIKGPWSRGPAAFGPGARACDRQTRHAADPPAGRHLAVRPRPAAPFGMTGTQRKTMARKMLIDAVHSEEIRVVVADGNTVEELDFESSQKRQLTGNMYLAKVTRVEPALQAAFVDYGGNRHGFLPFSEIHPDYYQIPQADREAVLSEQMAEADAQDASAHETEKSEKRTPRRRRGGGRGNPRLPMGAPHFHSHKSTAAPHQNRPARRLPGRLARICLPPTATMRHTLPA